MSPGSADVTVKLDDRLRLVSAVLALTQYPDDEHKKFGGRGSHLHARNTRKQLAEYVSHPAVTSLQTLLERGAPLDAIFTLALVLKLDAGVIEKPPKWMPPDWDKQLRDFYENTALKKFWAVENEYWLRAVDESRRVLADVAFKPFLSQFVGAFPERLVFIPNISYPAERELCIRMPGEFVCFVPPRVAWGESPPWPFDEDPAHVYRAVVSLLGNNLMLNFLRTNAEKISLEGQKPLPLTEKFMSQNPAWAEQFTYLFVTSAVAMFLEDHVSRAEANAYVLMERKVTGLDILPAAITVYRRYMREVAEGHYSNILDFIPTFSRQLRVAHRVSKL